MSKICSKIKLIIILCFSENEASETQKRLHESLMEESRRINRFEADHPTDLSIRVKDEKLHSDAFEETLKQVGQPQIQWGSRIPVY